MASKHSAGNTRSGGTGKNDAGKQMPLGRKNYILMLVGLGMVILGFVLMSGGGSGQAEVFSYDIFSFRRITLAPILVLGGFVVEIVAIMKRYK